MNILYRGGSFSYNCKATSYEAGMVVTFSGNREVDICDEIKMPIGFLANSSSSPYEWSNPVSAHILIGTSEFQTDVYEQGVYKIGDFLYCSRNGKLTNEAGYRGNIIVGIVNTIINKFGYNNTHDEEARQDIIGVFTIFSKGLERPAPEKKENFSRYRILKEENK